MREICTSGSDRGAARRLPSLPDLKRIRTADCVVVGVAGEESAPMLVLALRHTDGELRHLGRLGVSSVILIRGSLRFDRPVRPGTYRARGIFDTATHDRLPASLTRREHPTPRLRLNVLFRDLRIRSRLIGAQHRIALLA
jgi:hypothetical protein